LTARIIKCCFPHYYSAFQIVVVFCVEHLYFVFQIAVALL
jgi:hypothetical protein